MAASTLRFAIIIALVVGGVVVINQAFPSAPSGGTGPIDDIPATTTTPPATTSPPESPAETTPTPTHTGVRIAVFNGTGVSGLAGDTTAELTERYGYVAVEPADAPSPVPVTTIYYRKNKDRIEADFLASDFFKKLEDVRVTKLQAGADVDPDVQLAIYLGTDYAALKG